MTSPPTVLFICQHNAGRSQLGAHLLEVIAPGEFVAKSAGITPAEHINPIVDEALQEVGADTGRAHPRRVTETDLAEADVVVTMKPGLDLPGLIRGRHLEWAFPNPDTWDLAGVRSLRDDIAAEIRGFLALLPVRDYSATTRSGSSTVPTG